MHGFCLVESRSLAVLACRASFRGLSPGIAAASTGVRPLTQVGGWPQARRGSNRGRRPTASQERAGGSAWDRTLEEIQNVCGTSRSLPAYLLAPSIFRESSNSRGAGLALADAPPLLHKVASDRVDRQDPRRPVASVQHAILAEFSSVCFSHLENFAAILRFDRTSTF